MGLLSFLQTVGEVYKKKGFYWSLLWGTCGISVWSLLGNNKPKKCCVRRVILCQHWLHFKLYRVIFGRGRTTSVTNWIPCVNRARAEGRTAASQADVSTVNSLEQSWLTCNQATTSPFTNTLLSATQAPLCPTASVLHNELIGIFSPPALVMKNSWRSFIVTRVPVVVAMRAEEDPHPWRCLHECVWLALKGNFAKCE